MKTLAEMRASMGPDPFELILRAADSLPKDWKARGPEFGFEFVRCRLRFTQDELAQKSGVAQSIVSRVEGGFDARLSTWRRLYAAMGFDLVLLPVSALALEELEKRAEQGRPRGSWMRQRARPRRRRAPPSTK
ncbi:MAG: helix-turn-helix domain-containing protein [Elusimicrobiota bacterium]